MPLDQDPTPDDSPLSGFMSLGGHLDELRGRLIKAIIVPLVIGAAPFYARLVETALREVDRGVIEATQAALAAHAVTGLDAVRAAPPLVVFSPAMGAGPRVLKAVLMRALYRHPTVVHKMDAARLVVADLFAAYLAAPQEMAAPYSDAQASPVRCLQRRVADYVAGMTDRFALREHARLTGRQALV